MGIKFHCPNGHKLNVKAFLAGKKGVCPKCGTKFRIPPASEPGLVDSDLEEGDAGASAIQPSNGSAVALRSQPAAAGVAVASRGAAAGAVSGGQAITAAHGGAEDPIAEAPQASWYVRPPSGGQFGPARGELMRTWLDEGRVTSDSLVWREGWPNWQTAGDVFPSLDLAKQEHSPPPAPLAGLTGAATPRSTPRIATKKGGRGMAIALLVGLSLLCLILVAVLAYVLLVVK
jgi:GYF domain 2